MMLACLHPAFKCPVSVLLYNSVHLCEVETLVLLSSATTKTCVIDTATQKIVALAENPVDVTTFYWNRSVRVIRDNQIEMRCFLPYSAMKVAEKFQGATFTFEMTPNMILKDGYIAEGVQITPLMLHWLGRDMGLFDNRRQIGAKDR